MQVLIIEDEHFAAKKLIKLIHGYDPDIKILEQLDSVEESVEWLTNNAAPDLLFMDIHLADGSSFEVFEHIQVQCPIIFTTAYDQYAIQAFKTKSVDYLLKPIKYQDLEQAMNKYNELFPQRTPQNQLIDISSLSELIQRQHKNYKKRFLVRVGNLIKTISTSDIAYFIFEDRTTLLVTHGARRYPVKHTLDELEELLDPTYFTRANRQFIVSIQAIQKIHPWFKGRLKLDLNPPQEPDLVVSAEKTKAFKAWLDQ